MKKSLILALCLFLPAFFSITAQEKAPAPAAPPSPGPAASQEAAAAVPVSASPAPAATAGDAAASDADAALSYIEMDIRTSSLMELAAWCRELGLSDGGSRDELAARLRTYYKITASKTGGSEQRIITIESARTTEYFTLEAVDEEYARLKGDVIVSLKDGAAVHRIKAREILYNRTRNVMNAKGNVEYVKEEGDSRETFKGDSITVNLDNWSSIFMEGASEKSKAGVKAAYRFAGTVISRNDEEVTVLTGAEISNSANEESYWSIHASKLWLLPGNDFAILNAVLKVGNVPLLYLPFFYYPSDEIVFHPVLGVRTREGAFLNTTTYILGRPKAGQISENSITKIFGSGAGDTAKIREGVFLRSSGERTVDPGNISLKLFADAYVRLGAFIGAELGLPAKNPFGETKFEAGVGVTRDIYQGQTPFFGKGGAWDHINYSDLFGLSLPIRFRFKALGSVQFQYGNFSWDMPYYSDPFVDRDFMRRSELMDWFAMLRDGVTAQDTDTISLLSSYEWRLNGSLSPRLNSLAPYLSSLSISGISSSLTFTTKNNSTNTSFDNPGSFFFYPNKLIIYSLSASLSGNPLSLGAASAGPAKRTGPAPGAKLLPDLPRSPWDRPADKPADRPAGTPADGDGGASDEQAPGEDPSSGDLPGENEEGFSLQLADSKNPRSEYSFTIPALAQRFDLPAAGGARLAVDYRFQPSSSSEMKFDYNGWSTQEEIDWSEISNILTSFGTTGDVGLSLSHSGGGAYSAALRFSGNWSKKIYWLNETASDYTTGGLPDPAKMDAARKQADKESYFTSSWDLSGSLRPFFRDAIFGSTSIQYSARGLLAKNTIEGTGGREWAFGKWDKDNIQAHQISASVNANVMDFSQTFSTSLVLPPLSSLFTASATLRAWISETSIRFQMKNFYGSDSGDFTIMPVTINQNFRITDWGSLGGFVEIDPERDVNYDERNRFTRLTANLSLLGFTAAFSASYARPYRMNSTFASSGGQLWELQTYDRFEPRSLDFRYAKIFEKKELLGNRFSFSVNVNTGLSFDLQRHTNSKLNFSLGLNFTIANFLDVQFSARSENNVLFRYKLFGIFFPAGPGDLYGDQEDNFFLDLLKSFNFFNRDDRLRSGFKLKELNLSLVHHLGDWNARLSVSMTPFVNTATRQYEFRNEVSFLIQWVPIEEIRTEMIYKENKLTVK